MVNRAKRWPVANTKKAAAKRRCGRSATRCFEEIDFGREFQDYLDPGYKTQEIEYKEDAPTFEQFLTRPPSLSEHLEWQLNMTTLEDDIRDPAICVIGNLNADGRLNATNEEMAAMEKILLKQLSVRARQ